VIARAERELLKYEEQFVSVNFNLTALPTDLQQNNCCDGERLRREAVCLDRKKFSSLLVLTMLLFHGAFSVIVLAWLLLFCKEMKWKNTELALRTMRAEFSWFGSRAFLRNEKKTFMNFLFANVSQYRGLCGSHVACRGLSWVFLRGA
jgi:hypothetical protein